MSCQVETLFSNGGISHRTRIHAIGLAAMLVVPAALLGFPSPPSGASGAPGEGTCASCHSGKASPVGSVAITFPGGLTYTPGTPQNLHVTVTETGQSRWGFETTALTSANAMAGSFASLDSNTQVLSGTIQYAAESSAGTQAGTANSASWTFTWTPPATNVGNVTFYIAGLASDNNGSTGGDDTFTATYTLSPASGGGGSTLTVAPTTLTFNSAGGATPPSQMFNVTSSGAAITFTTSATTNSGGNWLTATPAGGTTPLGVSVSVNPAGLAAGTYTGSVPVASASATNSPQNVGVTLNVTGGPPPTPNLTLNPAFLTFTSANGGPVSPMNVQVGSSSTALTFTASASTNTGGNWLSVNPPSGTTPATAAVSVNPTGLSAGSYTGTVSFTAAGAGNSPQSLGVTLIVTPQQPPPTNPGPLTFNFSVIDKQSDGSDRMLVSGQGSIDNSGSLTGSGNFSRYSTGSSGSGDGGDGGDDRPRTASMGTWKATGFVSFTPASSGRSGEDGGGGGSSGVLTINVQITPINGSPLTGTMRIADTGSDSGVTLTINGGSTFVPSGTGHVSIRTGGSGGGGDSGDTGNSGGESGSE